MLRRPCARWRRRPAAGSRSACSSAVRYAGSGPKRVDYWAARAAARRAGAFVPNHEVDELDWVALPEAAARLSYERDVVVLAEFAAGPRATVPLILLRHASGRQPVGLAGQDLPGRWTPRGAPTRTLAGLLAASAGAWSARRPSAAWAPSGRTPR